MVVKLEVFLTCHKRLPLDFSRLDCASISYLIVCSDLQQKKKNQCYSNIQLFPLIKSSSFSLCQTFPGRNPVKEVIFMQRHELTCFTAFPQDPRCSPGFLFRRRSRGEGWQSRATDSHRDLRFPPGGCFRGRSRGEA